MNRFRKLLFAFALTAGCVHTSYAPLRVPLQWKPTDDLRLIPAGAAADLSRQKIAVGPFVDERPEPRQIGKNIENGGNVPVSTGDGVGTFLGARFADVLLANNVPPASSGATRVVKAEVLRYFVTEENTYRADVALRFTVEDAAGAQLWQGIAEGKSNRFGKSFSADNYYEALSNAFLEVCKDLVAKPGFLEAFRQ